MARNYENLDVDNLYALTFSAGTFSAANAMFGDASITNQLSVNKLSTTGASTFNTVFATGASTFGGQVTVTAGLSVGSAATFEGLITATAGLSVNTLAVSSTMSAVGIVSSSTITGGAGFFTGAFTMGGALTVTNGSSLYGGFVRQVAVFTNIQTFSITSANYCIEIYNTTTASTVILPTVASNIGKEVVIQNLNTLSVTIIPSTGEKYNGTTTGTTTLSNPYDRNKLLCTSDSWVEV
jgi:hypothetical protein